MRRLGPLPTAVLAVLMLLWWTPEAQGRAQQPAQAPPAGVEPGSQCPSSCGFEYRPVCGSNGVTYTNDCTLARAACIDPNLSLYETGTCPSDFQTIDTKFTAIGGPDVGSSPLPCQEACIKIFLPVCGSDGVTYSNPCSLKVANCRSMSAGGGGIQTVFRGSCDEPAPTTVIGEPGTTGPVPIPVPGPPTPPPSSCNEQCTLIFTPVCGTDGQTYSNMCLLQVADCKSREAGGPRIALAYEAACDERSQGPSPDQIPASPASAPPSSTCSEQCTRAFLPVCGTNGQTYNNMCLLRAADCFSRQAGGIGVGLAYEAACDRRNEEPGVDQVPASPPSAPPTSSCSLQCTRIFAPVCGTDGKTYSNSCVLQSFDCKNREEGGPGVNLAFEAACDREVPDQGPVSPSIVPVSPSIVPTSSCSEQCTRIFTPVCGTDGKTYNNMCLLQVADCKSREAGGTGVGLAFEAACDSPTLEDRVQIGTASSCNEQCTRIFIQVCGTDGKTYNNMCLLQAADCKSREAGGSGVGLAYEAACDQRNQAPPPAQSPARPIASSPPASSCSEKCTKIFTPVCGTDGKTYNNMCLLGIADCQSREAGGPGVGLASESACDRPPVTEPPTVITSSCPEQCPRIRFPVCGSNGKTYSNVCLLELEDCKSREAGGPSITIAFDAPCDADRTATEANLVEPKPKPLACSRRCSSTVRRVCASDGNTYDNECLVETTSCENRRSRRPGIYIVHDGSCDTSLSQRGGGGCRNSCTEKYRPVCGSDGITYDNECLMDVANCQTWRNGGRGVHIVKNGECGKRRTSSPQSSPQTSQSRPQPSVADAPIVASLGVSSRTRTSPSSSSQQSSQTSHFTSQSHQAPSQGFLESNTFSGSSSQASDSSAPQSQSSQSSSSGSQSSTFGFSESDFSAFKSSQSQSSDQPQPSLSPPPAPLKPLPPVELPCPEVCTQVFSPVCGSDDHTYSNLCELEKTSCRQRSAGGFNLRKQFDGPCVAALPKGPMCNQRCAAMHQPVCGTDGETYGNPCLLSLASCLHPFADIAVASEGPCGGEA